MHNFLAGSSLPLVDVFVGCGVHTGHEIGHSIMHHTWALLAITQMNFGLMFWTFGYVQVRRSRCRYDR